MNQTPAPAIRVRVDPANPGQFFACCGLLELADRLWGGAEGWFETHAFNFCLCPTRASRNTAPPNLIGEIARCRLTNTMTGPQLHRLHELSSMPMKHGEDSLLLEEEKKTLNRIRREAPLVLHDPFNLRLDWYVDERAGGDALKTWAGQQSVLDIAQGMKGPMEAGGWAVAPAEDWFSLASDTESLPFNFDSNLGGLGSDRDVGFSFDPLKMIRVVTRPLVELGAFVGLERFRPMRIERQNRHRYSTWSDPLVPELAAAAACGLVQCPPLQTFEFRLLYRTKYLKSFLPAQPV
jgi:CRISPR-associated protein Csb3